MEEDKLRPAQKNRQRWRSKGKFYCQSTRKTRRRADFLLPPFSLILFLPIEELVKLNLRITYKEDFKEIWEKS